MNHRLNNYRFLSLTPEQLAARRVAARRVQLWRKVGITLAILALLPCIVVVGLLSRHYGLMCMAYVGTCCTGHVWWRANVYPGQRGQAG